MVRRRFYTPFFSGPSTTSTSTSASTSTHLLPTHASTTHALASAFVARSASPSHIVVDLAKPHVKDAVSALLNLKPLRQKVRSATVHANTLLSSPGRYGRIQFELSHLVAVFEKLAQLPHLTSLTIEMNYHVISLPVKVLLAALSTKKLKKLQLKHLQLIGSNTEEFEQLEQLAAIQTQLQSLTLESCRGIVGINALVQHLPQLVDLKLISTPLASTGALTRVHVVQLLTPTLRSLKLDDIPELNDAHCKSLAQALAWPGCQLEELHINSPMLADASAQALTQMLLLNTSLTRFALHIDSHRLGGYMASVLSANTPALTHLDIGLYNEKINAKQDCINIATALRQNCHITHLRLRLEIELETLPKDIVQAFETTVAKVPTVVLQALSIDDGVHRYPLPSELRLQLTLNQCGVRRLLHQQVRTPRNQVDTLLSTLALTSTASSNSEQPEKQLDATFTLLSNLPELFHLALDNGNLLAHTTNNAVVQEQRETSNASTSTTSLAHKTSKAMASATHASKEWKKMSMSLLRRSTGTTGSHSMPTPKKVKHLIPHAA